MAIVDFIQANRAEIDDLIAQARPRIERDAAHELAARRGELLGTWACEILPEDWLSVQEWREHESAYRRGYTHGFSQAMDNLQRACKPATWQALAGWFDSVLMRWRHARNKSERHFPPVYCGSRGRVPAHAPTPSTPDRQSNP